MSEAEARGIRFTIDHYLPQERYPELSSEYSNLMYACDTCNQLKGTAPTEFQSMRGYRFLRVDADDPDAHLGTDPMSPSRLKHKTADIGEYTLERLYLNREPLRRLRELRSRLSESADVLRNGMRALRGQPIQDLPVRTRTRFIELRERACSRGEEISEMVDDALIREANRSELLDAPSECDRDARQRREYLKKIKAPTVSVRRPRKLSP